MGIYKGFTCDYMFTWSHVMILHGFHLHTRGIVIIKTWHEIYTGDMWHFFLYVCGILAVWLLPFVCQPPCLGSCEGSAAVLRFSSSSSFNKHLCCLFLKKQSETFFLITPRPCNFFMLLSGSVVFPTQMSFNNMFSHFQLKPSGPSPPPPPPPRSVITEWKEAGKVSHSCTQDKIQTRSCTELHVACGLADTAASLQAEQIWVCLPARFIH